MVQTRFNQAERDVTAIHDRHSYDPEKRAALDAWGRRLTEMVTAERHGAAAIPLRRPTGRWTSGDTIGAGER
jgi:hypothetical protein